MAARRGLEVWVSLLDPDGRVLAKGADLITPDPLDIDEKSDFSVSLKPSAKPAPGSKLMFTYRYNGVEDTEGSASWMQSFESEL